MSVADLIAKDSRVKKLAKMIKNKSYSLNTTELLNEIQSLHLNRRGRNLTVKEVMHSFTTKMIDATLNSQANRSRISEIKMQTYRVYAKLEKHVSLIRKHVKSTYTVQLARVYGTAADRENIIDTVIEPALIKMKDLKLVLDIADIAIKDLDEIGWNFKLIVKVMEIQSERKTAKV